MIVKDLKPGDQFGELTVEEVEDTAIFLGQRYIAASEDEDGNKVPGGFEGVTHPGKVITFEDGTSTALGDNFEVPEAPPE